MIAIHSNWTKPRILSHGSFFAEDFDILTTILSALKWREKNGIIKMATDSIGYEFYKSRGMCSLWDEVTTELDKIPDYVDANMFWAAGKLFALKNASAPTAVIDTDFIVWDRLAFDNLKDITVIHSEELYSDVYPDIHHFRMKPGYIFNPDLNWYINPSNTAFYVIKNASLKDMYVNEATEFIKNSQSGDALTYMVFAEQRLLPMCAHALGITTDEFSSVNRLFEDGERYFTHIWGMKQQMRENPVLREDFCRKCIRRIQSDFSEYVPMLKNIPELSKYM